MLTVGTLQIDCNISIQKFFFLALLFALVCIAPVRFVLSEFSDVQYYFRVILIHLNEVTFNILIAVECVHAM